MRPNSGKRSLLVRPLFVVNCRLEAKERLGKMLGVHKLPLTMAGSKLELDLAAALPDPVY